MGRVWIGFKLVSDGAPINAVMYQAGGAGPHAAVLLLHGFPGNERNYDLAQALRRAGYHVLTFNYRGTWGSAGLFSFVHAVEDAGNALAFLRSAAAKERYNIDPQRIVVVGHSFGGYVALRATARDAGVRAVAALSPLNGTAAELKGWPARRAANQDVNVEGGPVVAASLEAAIVQAPGYDFLRELAPLRNRPVLLIAASRDTVLPMSRHHEPIARALRDSGVKQLEIAIFDDDHVYSAQRIALMHRVVAWVGKHVAP